MLALPGNQAKRKRSGRRHARHCHDPDRSRTDSPTKTGDATPSLSADKAKRDSLG
ncbi:hypothetical protein LHGZ1_2799 [Laribacter hongkongensis]|uniref:Uncharacterized protein n=1 Tax=Laribacter hongkongensis TaxID=168471 RepID=A0A248LLF7_9NEIS|nr:hypothetical protein LHGZ1_2799 [Laribacter hongkongensis]